MFIWGEGNLPVNHPGRTEYFALPDPNLYFAQALRAALERRGVSIGRGTEAIIDNWFAEMLVKILGRERGSGGSWTEGLGRAAGPTSSPFWRTITRCPPPGRWRKSTHW